MAEPVTSIVVQFTNPVLQETFRLKQDLADQDDSFAAVYTWPRVDAADLATPGKFSKPGSLRRYGRASFRVYASASRTFDVLALDPLTTPEPANKSFSPWFGVLVTPAPSGYDGDQVVKVGRRTEDITAETLSFRGSREAAVAFNHDSPSVEVTYTSNFINRQGEQVTPPVQVAPGRFAHSEEVFGAIVVDYTTSYDYYYVFYEIANAATTGTVFETQAARNRIAYDRERPDPLPITVVVRDQHGAISHQIETVLYEPEVINMRSQDDEGDIEIDAEEVDSELSEDEFEFDDGSFITLQQYNTVTLRDPDTGRVYKFRFLPRNVPVL